MRPTQHPPSSISNRKRPKRESVGTVDLRGVTAVGGASPQNLQTVATDLLRLPYPALDHFSPATGPSQDFRPAATACKERHQMDTIQKNNQERALHTSDTSVEGVHSPLIYRKRYQSSCYITVNAFDKNAYQQL